MLICIIYVVYSMYWQFVFNERFYDGTENLICNNRLVWTVWRVKTRGEKKKNKIQVWGKLSDVTVSRSCT
jgi:hypothetical protein